MDSTIFYKFISKKFKKSCYEKVFLQPQKFVPIRAMQNLASRGMPVSKEAKRILFTNIISNGIYTKVTR